MSSLGRVRSKRRKGHFEVLNPALESSGYYHVLVSTEKGRKFIRVARLVALAFLPREENKTDVDHINRNKKEDRVENLRWATRSENVSNRDLSKIQRSHKYAGIVFEKRVKNKPWIARVKFQGKQISLGTFKSQEEAALARDMKVKELFGDFASLNFINKGDGI